MESTVQTIVLWGKRITGNVPDLALILRDKKFTLQAISDILHCSKNNISYHFIRLTDSGETISKNQLGKRKIAKRKRKHIGRKKILSSIETRKNSLIHILFSKNYTVGKEFDNFIISYFNLTSNPDEMINFYLRGGADTLSNRVTRSLLINQLFEKVNLNEFLEKGIVTKID